MKNIFFFIIPAIISLQVSAQKVYTKNGNISFFSKTALENISADNNQVTAILNQQTGELQFSVLIKAFHFKKALMEEHFNENYMESDKYPKATFKGSIADGSKINFTKDGNYPVTVNGDLSIHGVSNKVSVPGTISIKSGVVASVSSFNVKLADYKISIPKIVKDNIAETINITVNCNYTQKI
ncbi:MAG: YceI family protein [Rhizobacter sp.]|nr:YceI family protein [Ferruginibacter sp.]